MAIGTLEVAVLAGLALPPFRHAVLDKAEAAVLRVDALWPLRVEEGERLLAAGKYQEAAAYLAALDRRFPAPNVRNALDMDRERLLRALGRSYEGLGQKRQALEAYRRAAAFDSLDYVNFYDLATAALRLDEPDEAMTAFARVLQINPSNFPSVAAVIRYDFDASDYAGVARAYERYLDAFRLQDLDVRLAGGGALVPVAVDGLPHTVEVAVAAGPGWGGTLEVTAGGLPGEVRSVTLIPPVRAGIPGADPVTLVPRDAVWYGAPIHAAPDAAYADSAVAPELGPPEDDVGGPVLAIPVPPQPGGVARVRLTVRLIKPVDAATWEAVQTSYERLLEREALTRARERSAVETPTRGARP